MIPAHVYRQRLHVSIETEDRTYHGIAWMEDNESVVIQGSVGDNIGVKIAVPKSRILNIKWGRNNDEDS